MTQNPLSDLETKLGHIFADKSLLKQALTHASFAGPEISYERLEFLGDRVLGLLLAAHFYRACPQENEGSLSLRLHSEARMETLAMIAQKIGVASFVRTQTGMAIEQNNNVLADVVESLIAALYLDAGLSAAETFVLANWPLASGRPASRQKDAKSLLQEWSLQHGRGLPVYQAVSKSGPDHAPEMTYKVTVANAPPMTATGGSRKIAEQKAAAALLARLQAGVKD
jgi:ribonuclease-3